MRDHDVAVRFDAPALAGARSPSGTSGREDDDRLAKMLCRLPLNRVAGVLAGIPLEERLAGIPPAERLAGIPLEQALLALPDEILRGLSDEYIGSLPEHVQRAVRERLAR